MLEVFGKYSFEDAVAACDDNPFRVKKYLEAFVNYGYGDVAEREDWKKLFLYFCCMKGSDYVTEQWTEQWKKCLLRIKEMEDLTGCIEFHKRMEEKIGEQANDWEVKEHQVLLELAYLIVKEFASSLRSKNQPVEELDLEDCEELIYQYDLAAYEKEVCLGTFYVEELRKIIKMKQLRQDLGSGEVNKVLRVFRKLYFEKAVEVCENNILEVYECLKKCKLNVSRVNEDFGECEQNSFNGEMRVEHHKQDDVQDNFEGCKELFLYFCCMSDSDDIMEKCLSLVMEMEGSSGLDEFCRNLQNKRLWLDSSERDRKKMERKEDAIVQKLKKRYNNFENKQISSKSEQGFLTKIGVKHKKDIEQTNDAMECFLDKKGK